MVCLWFLEAIYCYIASKWFVDDRKGSGLLRYKGQGQKCRAMLCVSADFCDGPLAIDSSLAPFLLLMSLVYSKSYNLYIHVQTKFISLVRASI